MRPNRLLFLTIKRVVNRAPHVTRPMQVVTYKISNTVFMLDKDFSTNNRSTLDFRIPQRLCLGQISETSEYCYTYVLSFDLSVSQAYYRYMSFGPDSVFCRADNHKLFIPEHVFLIDFSDNYTKGNNRTIECVTLERLTTS